MQNAYLMVCKWVEMHLGAAPTCRDTKGRSRGRSRDPDRWQLLWTGTAHTAASLTDRRLQLHYGTSGAERREGRERDTRNTQKDKQGTR